jgi:hypothetical protein
MQGLTEGRIVHYVMPDNQHRPAIVVRVWDVSYCEGYVNLQVFTDRLNDGCENVEWKTSICYSENKEENTWHWIEPA